MPGRSTRSARGSITEAALQLVGRADLDDLVRVLTPERLAGAGDWAPSTVRYHFGGPATDGGARDFGFRRRELALEVVRLAVEQAERATQAAVERWNAALARMAGPQDAHVLVAAMDANLATFVPGGSNELDSAARDRVQLLALAVADDDPETARLLRESRARQIEAWSPPLLAYLDLAGRGLRSDRDIADLAAALFTLVDGHLQRVRTGPAAAPTWFSELLLTVVDAFTEPAPLT